MVKDEVEPLGGFVGEAFATQVSVLARDGVQQAELHLQIQKNAMRSVLLTVEGLGLLAAEQAINQALALVKDQVNAAVGFALL